VFTNAFQGKITLIRGDSTTANTRKRVQAALSEMGSERAQLAILHPPYADIIKFSDLKADLEGDYIFETDNKTEVVGALLHKFINESGISFETGRKLVDKLHGRATFALVALIHDGKEISMIALNDDKAFEPFCFAKIDGAFVVSSESCSHRRLNGHTEREYEGAEMTICSSSGCETKRLREEKLMPDVFQASISAMWTLRGKEIFQIRRNRARTGSLQDFQGGHCHSQPESGKVTGDCGRPQQTPVPRPDQTSPSREDLPGRCSQNQIAGGGPQVRRD
jgi:glutamine phosphoribosylpyrophosphate amidotransferase